MASDPVDPVAYEAAVGSLSARRRVAVGADPARMATLVELLGRPDRAYPAIQVAGTNGAGSTARMISCLLSALGLTTGCYTSSQLQDVRERIRVADEPISQRDLVERLDEIEPLIAEVDARHASPASFDEVVAALAFAHFADAPVDVAVVDAGAGDPGSAGSLARGEVAVATPLVGDEGESADALVERAERLTLLFETDAVVVTSPQAPEVERVIARRAEEQGGRVVTVPAEEVLAGRRLAVGGQQLDLRGATGEFDDVYVPLHGRHQALNASLALTAVEAFLGFAGGLDPEVIREGFAAVRVPGRMEVVRRTDASTVVLDAARNPAGSAALADALRDEFSLRSRILVVGLDADVAAGAVIAPLAEVAQHVIATAPAGSGAPSPDVLAAIVERVGTSVETAPDTVTALASASELAGEEDAVVVAGGFGVVGEAREALGLGVA